jgi:hypothetical protein
MSQLNCKTTLFKSSRWRSKFTEPHVSLEVGLRYVRGVLLSRPYRDKPHKHCIPQMSFTSSLVDQTRPPGLALVGPSYDFLSLGETPQTPRASFARPVTFFPGGWIEHPGPKDLLASHRTSWGILPKTPVFSLRSARCHWQSLITARQGKASHHSCLTEHLGPKDLLVSNRASWGILPQTPFSRFARRTITGRA